MRLLQILIIIMLLALIIIVTCNPTDAAREVTHYLDNASPTGGLKCIGLDLWGFSYYW